MQGVGDLLGKEIYGVAFVRDHVEFHFDGVILRSIADPYVTVGEATYRFAKAGSREALCMAIGSIVESLNLVEGEHFEFATGNGCRIRIPLDAASQKRGEAMHLAAGSNRPLRVW